METEIARAQLIGELLGTGPNHILTLRLAERRISPDVITSFGIKARGEGWTYPTPRGALRFKKANSDAKNKYAWIGEERDTLLYGLDLCEAIQQSDGDVWLVTEFDFFTMRSAGILNVIAQMQGEGSVPKELPTLLQSMGVLNCHIAPDRDAQGLTWAQLVADKFIPAGIAIYSSELPYPLQKKHGGDIGRLWQEYSRRQSFEQYLLSLPTTQLAAKAEVKRKKGQANFIFLEDRKVQIARALGVTSYSSKGYSKNLACPFHEDTKPSASLHRDFGLHCFKCGWMGWKKVAEMIGVEWENNIPEPVYRTNALGDELIQAMIKAGYSTLANVLEKLYRVGWRIHRVFSVKDLIAQGIPPWRARKAFAQMDGREADKRKQNKRAKKGKRESIFCGELDAFFLLNKEALILNKNSGRGRPTNVKRLPNPDDLAAVFRVKVTRYTQIATRSNMADWRAEVYALQIDREPGTYPRKALCQPLGISNSTAISYDKRARVIVTPNVERVELKNADGLPDTPELKATWLETEEVVTDQTGNVKFRQFAATKAGYSRASKNVAKHGGAIWLVKQLANDYRRTKE